MNVEAIKPKEKTHTLRNVIITVAILLVIFGAIRACSIAKDNQTELENKSVPAPSTTIKTFGQ